MLLYRNGCSYLYVHMMMKTQVMCPCVDDKSALSTNLPLQWRHNGHDGVSNHQPHHGLLNRLFRRRSKNTPKLRITSLCVENSPGTGEFPAQMASNAENVSIWWRHHVVPYVDFTFYFYLVILCPIICISIIVLARVPQRRNRVMFSTVAADALQPQRQAISVYKAASLSIVPHTFINTWLL